MALLTRAEVAVHVAGPDGGVMAICMDGIATAGLRINPTRFNLLGGQGREAHLLRGGFPSKSALITKACLGATLVVLKAYSLALDGKLGLFSVSSRHATVLLGDVNGTRLFIA